MSISVPAGRAEDARAQMLDLFPSGFEEIETGTELELVAYTDAAGEELLWKMFGGVRGDPSPARRNTTGFALPRDASLFFAFPRLLDCMEPGNDRCGRP